MGNKGKPAADSIVCLPSGRSPESGIEKKMRAARGDMKWHTHDAKALPTLHHIVERLAELPVIEAVKANVAEGKSMLNYDDVYVI